MSLTRYSAFRGLIQIDTANNLQSNQNHLQMKSQTVILSLLFFVSSIVFQACRDKNDTASPKGTFDSQNLNTWLDEAMKVNSNVPGMLALVSIPEELNWVNAQGIANQKNGELMVPNHQFVIASLTKPMTATIILQLIEEGKLELDAPVANWLSIDMLNQLTSIQGTAYGGHLTIEHLLNHTSGIFDYLNDGQVHLEAFLNRPEERYTLQDRIEIGIREGSTELIPGEGYIYSNTNYILLGMIIEKITGEALSTQFRKRIFQPLAMSNSYIAPNENDIQELARGYYQDFDITDFTTNFNWNNPAGGVISTLQDLEQFMRGLASGQLFTNSNSMARMKEFGRGGYGLGIQAFSNSKSHGLVWGHDGGDPGYFSFMIYIEKRDAVIIFAGNRADIEVEESAYFVNKVIDALSK